MNNNNEHMIGGPKGCLKPNITTVNGGSPKLGPGTSIHGGKPVPEIETITNQAKIKNAKVRCVVVGNIKYEPLVEGNVYLVYRKHEQTGEPTYSLCVYKNGNWVPYGLEQCIGSIQGFVGIPVLDDDYWVCANTVFADGEVCNIEFEKPTVEPEPEQEPEKRNPDDDTNEETVQEYVKRRHEEIAKEEAEEQRKAKEDEMRRETAGEFIPRGMPITPSPESSAIRSLNLTIEILMEYIQKLKDGIVNEPVIEQNWEHLKNFTNGLLDRILDIERRLDNMPITLPGNPLPYQPYTPASPNTPLTPGYPTPPSVPEWPAWPPYGPIISYSLPGGVNITSTVGDVIKTSPATGR